MFGPAVAGALLAIAALLVAQLRTAELVVTANTLAEVEHIVRVPVLLRLQEELVRVRTPVTVAEVPAVVAGRSVEVLRRLVAAVLGSTDELLLDVPKDLGAGDVDVRRVGAGQFDLEPSDVGERQEVFLDGGRHHQVAVLAAGTLR